MFKVQRIDQLQHYKYQTVIRPVFLWTEAARGGCLGLQSCFGPWVLWWHSSRSSHMHRMFWGPPRIAKTTCRVWLLTKKTYLNARATTTVWTSYGKNRGRLCWFLRWHWRAEFWLYWSNQLSNLRESKQSMTQDGQEVSRWLGHNNTSCMREN